VDSCTSHSTKEDRKRIGERGEKRSHSLQEKNAKVKNRFEKRRPRTLTIGVKCAKRGEEGFKEDGKMKFEQARHWKKKRDQRKCLNIGLGL